MLPGKRGAKIAGFLGVVFFNHERNEIHEKAEKVIGVSELFLSCVCCISWFLCLQFNAKMSQLISFEAPSSNVQLPIR